MYYLQYNNKTIGGRMKLGTVLWWSERDNNGIIVDSNGNEFYFDSSVLKLDDNQIIKRRMQVSFKQNDKIKECPCACDVTLKTNQ